jgi:hypothetical protein
MKIKVSTRVVFIFKDYVVKVPISLRGYLQCLQEAYIWDKYKHLNLVGELYWFKYGIVCMKRYDPIKAVDHYDIANVKGLIKELDIDMCDLYNKANWGELNGKRYLIDYGINEEISKMYNL